MFVIIRVNLSIPFDKIHYTDTSDNYKKGHQIHEPKGIEYSFIIKELFN